MSSARGGPDALAENLVLWLTSEGFSVVNEKYSPEAFGNRFIVLSRPPVRVALTKDRGEWLVGVGTGHGRAFYEPSLWRSALQRLDPAKLPSRDDEFALLRQMLREIDLAVRRKTVDWRVLQRLRSDKLATQLLRPPPAGMPGEPLLLTPATGSIQASRDAAARVARAKYRRRHPPP